MIVRLTGRARRGRLPSVRVDTRPAAALALVLALAGCTSEPELAVPDALPSTPVCGLRETPASCLDSVRL